MIDFAAARRMMVDGQVRTSDVTDLRIIAAMLELPRERFVPEGSADLAYLDLDVTVTKAPAGATGYSSALLARLARSVVALEEDPALVRFAQEALAAVGAGNVTVVTGPLTQGWQPAAPYDVIFVNGATEVPPDALCRQLKDGGRLVAVVGRAPSGRAMVYRAVGADVSGWPVFDAAAPLLPGFAAPAAFVF
jgi:protein-L-isoaspartate(D-aspartate) O-methyltransferase